MKSNNKIRFENSLAKKLYLEISGISDVSAINKRYITQEYIWELWQQVYKSNYGCTSYVIKNLSE